MENNKGSKFLVRFLVFIIIILLIVISGGIGWYLGKEGKISNNNSVEENKTIEETKKEENKTEISKKIDESKPWVYDAEYLKNKTDKVKTSSENLNFSSSKEINVPYININSADARRANEEIKAMCEKAYENFGELLEMKNIATGEITKRDDFFKYTGYGYKFYEKNNILSVIIIESTVSVPGDGHSEYKIYNFNLETLNKASMFEVAKTCGFTSEEALNASINNSIEQAKKDLIISENATRNDNLYFVDKDGKFNIMVLDVSELGLRELVISVK